MSHLGDGYGSEYHLLRFLGRHRGYLDSRVLERTGATRIEWLDWSFDRRVAGPDAERTGLDFIDDARLRDEWADFFPARGLSWDGVAQLRTQDASVWLLLDASSHVDELRSSCSAQPPGRERIRAALDATKRSLGVAPEHDWLSQHYGFCARLAALHFLTERGIDAQLLSVFFVGDDAPRRRCPADPGEWKETLDERARYLGLPPSHALSRRLHELFLPVCPEPISQ